MLTGPGDFNSSFIAETFNVLMDNPRLAMIIVLHVNSVYMLRIFLSCSIF